MVKFIIVRHGYSQGNKENRFSGQLDCPLDEVGLRQAENVSNHIMQNFLVDAIYASDLSRAYQTVVPLANALHIPIRKLCALREVDVGEWQGKLITDVEKEYPSSFALYRKYPGLVRFDGGESYADLQLRVVNAFTEIANENEGKTVVVCVHGGVIRVLRAKWLGVSLENIKEIPHVPNASVSVVEYSKGKAEFLLVGNTEHLQDKTTEMGVR